MTVAELRKALEGLPDDLPVAIIERVSDLITLREAIISAQIRFDEEKRFTATDFRNDRCFLIS